MRKLALYWWVLGSATAGGLFACNASNSSSPGGTGTKETGCLTCAEAECPNESAACEDLAGCRALRSCTLGCTTDACKNDCVADVADDAEAILASASFLACATANCSECRPSATNGAGGNSSVTSSTASVNTATSSAASNNAVTSSTSSTTGADIPARCDYLFDWAVGCVADGNPQVTACDATPLSQCRAACHLDATCNEYEEAQSGVNNDLTGCLLACDVAYGGATEATCANAQGKRVACGITIDIECSDTSALDRCFNQCVMDNDCDAINNTLPQGQPNPFGECYDACEANNSTSPNFIVEDGGYVTTLSWHGYAWTATDGLSGSTITPSDFSTLTSGSQLCASGTVAGTADYSAVAMLGINLSQEQGDPAPDPSFWNPSSSSSGVYYNITNNAGTPLRIQIQAPGGDADPNSRWCAEIVGQSGDIFWTAFSTECWEGGLGTYYGGAGSLESIMVLVPGDLVSQSFDFCIYELRSN